MVVLYVNLNQQSPLLGVLSQLSCFNQSLRVLSAHIYGCSCIKDGNLVLIVLNQLTDLVELLLLHVTVQQEGSVVLVIVYIGCAVGLLVDFCVVD